MNITAHRPEVHSRSANGTPLYERRCACGAVAMVDRRKLDKPCHACAMKARRTHGLATKAGIHPLYRLLKSMVGRCTIPSASNFAYYGGRGIRVCDQWTNSPAAFVAWAESNGWRPGAEIDRIDPDGAYEPANCRFVTHRENSQRTRRISTTVEQARQVRAELAAGRSVTDAAATAGVTYMVAWHIRQSADIWRES